MWLVLMYAVDLMFGGTIVSAKPIILSGMITKYSSGANLYLCFEYVLFIADLFPMTGYYGGGYGGGYGRRRYGGCECPQ